MAAKKTRDKSDKPMSKTAFIRSMGPDVPPGEVIAKAKEQGLELAKKLVYTTQSEMRTGGKGAGKKGKAPKGKKVTVRSVTPGTATPVVAAPVAAKPTKRKKPGPKAGFRKKAAKAAAAPAKASNGSTAEQKLKALVIELGTARADEVYRAVKGQLNAILGA
jgi:hypothetical protein